MSQQSGATRFLAPSPSDVPVKDPNTRSKFSYTREFLLSFAKLYITELPREVHLSISRVFEDACNLLPPPICDSDSRCDKTAPQLSSLNGLGNMNNLLHRSKKPYWPPSHYKALPPSSRDNNDLHNNEIETSGSSFCMSQEKVKWERWRKGLREEKSYAEIVRLTKEDHCHFNEHIDSKESSQVFLMSTALMTSGNLNNLQSTSKAITKQLDASHQRSLIEGAFRGPKNTKNYSTQDQSVQGVITNNTLNLWEKSVNHVNNNDASKHLISLLEKGMQLKESKACSNPDLEHPDITPNVVECQKESCPANMLGQEKCGNLVNDFKAVQEKAGLELQLGNTSVCVHGPAGEIAKTEASEAFLSPPAGDRLYLSMVDKCESSMVHCGGGIWPLHGFEQVDSISMKQNPLRPDVHIQQELELNSFCSLDRVSTSSSELCLPDEDSLIRFDEPFLMPDMESWAVIGDSISSPERNQIKGDDDSSSLPGDVAERLVESILNDDSSPTSHLDDPQVHHKAGLNTFCHSLQPLQSFTHFCPNQDRSTDLSSYASLTLDSFPSSMRSQPFPLSHDRLSRFDHDAGHAIFQQMANTEKLDLCFYYGPQTWQTQTPHLPTRQIASYPQKLNSNSMQDCTMGYQDPSYAAKCRFCS